MNSMQTEEPFGFAGVIMLLNRCLQATASILDADVAMIMLTDDQKARLIASHGTTHKFFVHGSPLAHLPYRRDETFILPDAGSRPDILALLGNAAPEEIGFFYRRPLILHDRSVISLIVHARTARPAPRPHEQRIIDELASTMADECRRIFPDDASILSVTAGMSEPDLATWHGKTRAPAAIFDKELTLRAVNDPLRNLFAWDIGTRIGLSIDQLDLPARENLALLFRNALRAGISTPRLELTLDDGPGTTDSTAHVYAVMGSPVVPAGQTDPVLIVTIEDITGTVAQRRVAEASQPGEEENPAAATIEFLMETLVRRRALRSRKGISYVTSRSWRQPIRAHQIRALRALKRNATRHIAETIAIELESEVVAMIGVGAFRAVVPVPCGHSAPDRCLSQAIALCLAKRLNLPMIEALGSARLPGSSHPKTNTSRPPLHLIQEAEGPILLVDDVATSGRHIEEACLLLRPKAGTLLALAWIGGDSNDDLIDD